MFAATSCIPCSSGRLSTTPPSVRTHGSNAARIRAPPLSIVDGPSNTVADCGGQSGVAVTVPAKFCTVNLLPLLTVTWLLLTLVMIIGVGEEGIGDGEGDGVVAFGIVVVVGGFI
jgi:hypothetical protein